MNDEVIFELLRSMDIVTNNLIIEWNRMFQEELSISHVLVLGRLNVNGKNRPSDLAKALGLTPSTITYLSRKLIKNKLVKTSADTSDQRIKYLEITDDGVVLLTKAIEDGKKLHKKLFEQLTEDEFHHLLTIYQKLAGLIVGSIPI